MLKIKNKNTHKEDVQNKKSSGKKIKNKETKYVQELLGIKEIKDNTISVSRDNTDTDKLLTKYYIRVNPKNINILQDNVLLGLVDNLKKILNTSDNVEVLVVDKTERVDDNKNYLKELIDRKENPVYKELLQKDLDSLNEEFSRSASREFYFIVPYKNKREIELIKQFEGAIGNNSFEVLKTTEHDTKNMLQVYLERNFTNIVVKEDQLPENIEDQQIYSKSFIDRISPSVLKFLPDHYVMGNTYRRTIAIRNYPLETEKMALLRKVGEKNNVTLKIYYSKMGHNEYEKSIESSVNKNTNEAFEYQITKRAKAEQHLGIAENLVKFLNANPEERMFKVSVFIEVIGNSKQEMEDTFNDVKFMFEGMTYDNLYLKQKEGFLSVNPIGSDQFDIQFERHMPSSSAANIFLPSYSEKIDTQGFPLGRDKSGGKLIIDLDKRDRTHTNSNLILLGNSGEGKSYLLNLIKTNWRLKGKSIIGLDPDGEAQELTENLKGTYMNMMSGKYIINVLEPKIFSESEDSSEVNVDEDDYVPTFSKKTVLSQHISFLRDFFRTYKNMDDTLLDVLEIMLEKTYLKFNMTYESDLSGRKSTDFPILSDLYKTSEDEFRGYENLKYPIYSKEMLQKLLLNINSICRGADSNYFNGHTNIRSYDFLMFGVKELLETAENLKNAVLFNLLTFMNSKLLVEGDTACTIDEFYLFLDNPTMVKYIRNYMKRVRKKDSAIVLASQNIEDYLQKDIAELTKPLFAIPTYKFLFYPGSIDKKLYMDLLNINESEYNLIKSPGRGNTLFISGTEKYNLQVEVPEYKSKLFGTAGGR